MELRLFGTWLTDYNISPFSNISKNCKVMEWTLNRYDKFSTLSRTFNQCHYKMLQ